MNKKMGYYFAILFWIGLILVVLNIIDYMWGFLGLPLGIKLSTFVFGVVWVMIGTYSAYGKQQLQQ